MSTWIADSDIGGPPDRALGHGARKLQPGPGPALGAGRLGSLGQSIRVLGSGPAHEEARSAREAVFDFLFQPQTSLVKGWEKGYKVGEKERCAIFVFPTSTFRSSQEETAVAVIVVLEEIVL